MSEDVTQFRRHLNEGKVRVHQNCKTIEAVRKTLNKKENFGLHRKDILSVPDTDTKNLQTKCHNESSIGNFESLNAIKPTGIEAQMVPSTTVNYPSHSIQSNLSKMCNSNSDNPTTPVYPPRSPTSEIVPNGLPIRHCYPNSTLAKDTEKPIHQVDGSSEAPIECLNRYINDNTLDLTKVLSVNDRPDRMTVKSTALNLPLPLCPTGSFSDADLEISVGTESDILSSSSVSSIGSRSSVTGSMYETVGNISRRSSSSDYGSELNEINMSCININQISSLISLNQLTKSNRIETSPSQGKCDYRKELFQKSNDYSRLNKVSGLFQDR